MRGEMRTLSSSGYETCENRLHDRVNTEAMQLSDVELLGFIRYDLNV